MLVKRRPRRRRICDGGSSRGREKGLLKAKGIFTGHERRRDSAWARADGSKSTEKKRKVS